MRPAFLVSLALAGLAGPGCEQGHVGVRPPLAKSAGSATTSPPEPLAEQVAFEHYRVRQYLRPPAVTPDSAARRCPDPSIDEHTPDDAARTLVVRVADGRTEPRFLVPLRITERLESHEIPALGSEPGGPGAGLLAAPARAPSMSAGQAERLLGELARLRQRRYLGVYHITDFRGPELVLKVGELKRSWVPGIFRASFVIYDLRDQAALCALPVLVKNDTRDAPIRSRLRSETRTRLEEELGRAVVDASRKALAGITSALKWPSGAG